MIKVVAKHILKEGKLDEFLQTAKVLVEATNKSDAGCIRYELYQDTSDPSILAMLEEWEDQPSIDKHLSSVHFKKAAPTLDGLCSKPVEINMYKKLL